MKKNTIFLLFGMLLFLLGLLASMAFNVFVLWANLEGQSFWGFPEALAFDTSLTREARLGRLSCPLVLVPGEVKFVEVSVSNPNDYDITAWVSAHISMPGMTENMVRDTQGVPLAPKGRATLRWEISESNVLNERMALVRVFLRLTEGHPPSRTKHCGMIRLDIAGLSGRAITILTLLGGHILQVLGIYLWWQGRTMAGKRDQFIRNIMLALSIFSLLMSLSSLIHSWAISMIIFLLTLLLVFTSIGYQIGKIDQAPRN